MEFFVHKYRWSHDARRRQFKWLGENGIIKKLRSDDDGFYYDLKGYSLKELKYIYNYRKKLVASGHAEYVLENDKAVFKLKECR